MPAFTQETLAVLRRRVGTLLDRLQYGTLTSATASTFVAEFIKKFPDDAERLVGGTAYIVSGTGAGQSRLVTATTQSSGTATVSPNWTTNPDNTSVIEVFHGDLHPDRIKEALNLAILDVQELVMVQARENPSALDTTNFRHVTIPATFVAVYSLKVVNDSDAWTTYKMAQDPSYLDEHPNSCALVGTKLYVRPTIASDATTATIYVYGYKKPGLLSSDSDTAEVRSDFLTYFACHLLDAGEAASNQLDPEDHGGRAANWLRLATTAKGLLVRTDIEPDTQLVGA